LGKNEAKWLVFFNPTDRRETEMPLITREVLRAYISDALPDSELAAVERALRDSTDLRALLKDVIEQEDRGEHTAGAIWRRERISCPTRDQLGGYLLGAGDAELLEYIRFHIDEIGCPYCHANLDDLRSRK
jgi:hypothetical protein